MMMLNPAAGRPLIATNRTLALPPFLGSVPAAQPAADAPEDALTRAREQRDNRNDHHELAGTLAAAPTSADLINDSERNVEVGSRAFAREQGRADLTDRAQGRAEDFRAALSKARPTTDPAPVAVPSAAPTPPTATPAPGPTTTREPAPAATTALPSAPVLSEPGGPQGVPTASESARATPNPVQTLAAAATQSASTVPPAPAAPAAIQAAQRTVAPIEAARPTAPLPSREGGPRPLQPVAETGGARRFELAAAKANKTTERAPADQAESAERVARVLRLSRSLRDTGRTQATLRLDPPELGTLRLHMDLRKDVLALRIETETNVARELLQRDVDDLRRSLAEAGIQLGRIEMRSAEDRSEPPGQPGGWTTGSQPDADGRPTGRGGRGFDGTASEAEAEVVVIMQPGPATESLVNILA